MALVADKTFYWKTGQKNKVEIKKDQWVRWLVNKQNSADYKDPIIQGAQPDW